jgi:hypothetical protein
LLVRAAGDIVVKECKLREALPPLAFVAATTVAAIAVRGSRKKPQTPDPEPLVFPTSIYEITCAINALRGATEAGALRPFIEPETKALPKELSEFKDLFDKSKASGLPPHRGTLDHHIHLEKGEDGRIPAPP